MLKIIIIVIVFIILLAVKTFNDPVQGRCLAVLVAAAMLWASEALPLYTTALLIPLLVVTCKVCKTREPMIQWMPPRHHNIFWDNVEFHNYDINWWVYISCSIIKI